MLDRDDQELIKYALCAVGCGCLIPSGILALFIWACVAIFRWGFR